MVLVLSRLDYSNGVLIGLPAYLHGMSTIVSTECIGAADLRCTDHITDVLINRHWLRVPERIHYIRSPY